MPIGGGDVESGEAIVDGSAPEQRGIFVDGATHRLQVARLDGGEEVTVVARSGAAQPLAHLVLLFPPSISPGSGGGKGGGGGSRGEPGWEPVRGRRKAARG